MMNHLFIVDSSILPEVYSKVIEAKRYLSSKVAKNTSQAIKMAGISRSAFYKYKDHISAYTDSYGKIITFQGVLSDRPGVLSSVIGELYRLGANILTVNQDLPSDEKASVSLTVSCDNIDADIDIKEKINSLDGVISFSQVIG